jgi:hypothetical protein
VGNQDAHGRCISRPWAVKAHGFLFARRRLLSPVETVNRLGRFVTVFRLEARMIILEPNGRLDREQRPRRSLLIWFWEGLVRLLEWR